MRHEIRDKTMGVEENRPLNPPRRPGGVAALGIFFLAGAVISGVASVSLASRWRLLEPMWQWNPRARDAFARMGSWSIVLLVAVCAACAAAALGVLRGRVWGYRLCVSLVTIQLVASAVNGALGPDRRALAGLPFAAALLVYLSTNRVRKHFDHAEPRELLR